MSKDAILTIVAVLVVGLSHAMQDGTWPKSWKISHAWRGVFVALCGIASGTIDRVETGVAFADAFGTCMKVSGAAFVVLLLSALGDSGDPPAPPAAPSGTPKGPGLMAAALTFMLALTPGCGILRAATPTIDELGRDLGEAITWLNIVEQATAFFFALHPNPAKQALVDDDLGNVAVALNSLELVANGSSDLANANETKALADFKNAYDDLEKLLTTLGVKTPDGAMESPGLAMSSTFRWRAPHILTRVHP